MANPCALVLGAAVWQGGVASPAMSRRTLHAVWLFHNGQIDHIVTCGGIGKHGPSEAEVMRRICLENGVPPDCISLEDQSTTTFENIRNAQALLDQSAVIIVTDKYHALRAKMTARHLGLQASSSSPNDARANNFKAYLREAYALAYYFIKFRLKKQ